MHAIANINILVIDNYVNNVEDAFVNMIEDVLTLVMTKRVYLEDAKIISNAHFNTIVLLRRFCNCFAYKL
jgi:hypothetical protein